MGVVLDEDTTAVLTALLINTVIGVVILVGWLIIRKFRGDKQKVDDGNS